MIVKTSDKPVFYAIEQADGMQVDTLQAGDYLATSRPIRYDESEMGLLKQLPDWADKFPPLPKQGERVEAGQIYRYADGLVMARQSHTRTEHDVADVPALFLVYRENADQEQEWIVGEQVQVGTLRRYQEILYECLQAHVTQADWTPDRTPALWRKVSS